MAVAPALVGCLPTYATAGALAPALFTIFRLVQGLSWRPAPTSLAPARSAY